MAGKRPITALYKWKLSCKDNNGHLGKENMQYGSLMKFGQCVIVEVLNCCVGFLYVLVWDVWEWDELEFFFDVDVYVLWEVSF
jgi:hypothetical protein